MLPPRLLRAAPPSNVLRSALQVAARPLVPSLPLFTLQARHRSAIKGKKESARRERRKQLDQKLRQPSARTTAQPSIRIKREPYSSPKYLVKCRFEEIAKKDASERRYVPKELNVKRAFKLATPTNREGIESLFKAPLKKHEQIPSSIPEDVLQEKWSTFCLEVLEQFNAEDMLARKPEGIPSSRRLNEIWNGRPGLEVGSLKLVQRKNEVLLARALYVHFLEYIGAKPRSLLDMKADLGDAAADLRFPGENYPVARQIQRIWHLHVGPTNSGKTYHALKRLEQAKGGVYASPLRLLAQEIYERMNAKGIPCNLVTGDDVRRSSFATSLVSSTTEMVQLQKPVEVAVIDEIQMIGDRDRGWAWTRALLGVQAQEVHMCGEERVVDLITKLCESVGDKLIIHRYKRLGPLEVEDNAIEDLSKIQKGDCVVTFSRKNIFILKERIEQATNKRCAVIYGSLPSETRSAQAQLFNDPDSGYDILVASDAVGMGLNLSIKRVVFEALSKWNGLEIANIEVPQVKQIAGRAGRYKSASEANKAAISRSDTVAPLPAAPSVGYVSTLSADDLPILKKRMETDVPQLKTAGLIPTDEQTRKFMQSFPELTFSEALIKMDKYLRTSNLYHMCNTKGLVEVAAVIDDVKDMTIEERMSFINAPIGREPACSYVFHEMATAVATNGPGSILDLKSVDLECLDMPADSIDALRRLEILHKVTIMYLWLSWRFPSTFTPRETAIEVKDAVEDKIMQCLKSVSHLKKDVKKREALRRRAAALAKKIKKQRPFETTDGEPQWDEMAASEAIEPNPPVERGNGRGETGTVRVRRLPLEGEKGTFKVKNPPVEDMMDVEKREAAEYDAGAIGGETRGGREATV